MSAAPTTSNTAPGPSAIAPWVIVTALGLLTGLQPLTTDLYLPALPQMQQLLAQDKNATHTLEFGE